MENPSVPLEYVQPLNEMVNELKLMEKELNEARAESSSLSQRVRTLEWELTSAQTSAETLRGENERLQAKITDLVQASEAAAIGANTAAFEASHEIQALRSQNKVLEQHLASMSSPSGLSGRGSGNGDSDVMLRQLETMREQTRAEYESVFKNMQLEFDTSIGSLRSAKASAEAEAAHLGGLLKETRSQLEMAHREVSSFKSQLDSMGLQAGQASASAAEVASLKAQLQAAHAQMAASAGGPSYAPSQMGGMMGGMGSMAQINQQETYLLRDEIASLSSQNQRLKDALRSKNETVNEMVAELAAMKDQMLHSETRILHALGGEGGEHGGGESAGAGGMDREAHGQILALERGKAQLNDALNSARDDNVTLGDEIARLKSKLGSVTRRLEEAENDRAEAEREFASKERGLVSDRAALKIRVSALADDLSEVKDRSAATIRELRRKLKEAEAANDTEAHEEAMAELQAKYSQERRALHMAVLAREEIERDLASKSMQWASEKAGLKERIDTLSEELDDARMTATAAQREAQRAHATRDKVLLLEDTVHTLEGGKAKALRQLALETDAKESLERELAKVQKAAAADKVNLREQLAEAVEEIAKANEKAELASADAHRKVKAVRMEMEAVEDALRKADGGVALANRAELLESQLAKAESQAQHLEERLKEVSENGQPELLIELAVAKRDLENAQMSLEEVKRDRDCVRGSVGDLNSRITALQLELAAVKRDAAAAHEKLAEAQIQASTHVAAAEAARAMLNREREKFDTRVREMESREKERERERLELERIRDLERERLEADREKERERLRERERVESERERAERERERVRALERERERERREADREARRVEEERTRVREMERVEAERERERSERERLRDRERDEVVAKVRAQAGKDVRKAEEAAAEAEAALVKAQHGMEAAQERYAEAKGMVDELTGTVNELRAQVSDLTRASAEDAIKLEDNAIELSKLREEAGRLKMAVDAADGVLSTGTLVDNEVLASLERDARRVDGLEPKVGELHAAILAKTEEAARAVTAAAADAAALRNARAQIREMEEEVAVLTHQVETAQVEVAAKVAAYQALEASAQEALDARDGLVEKKTNLEWELGQEVSKREAVESELASLRAAHDEVLAAMEAEEAASEVEGRLAAERAAGEEKVAKLQARLDRASAALKAEREEGEVNVEVARLQAELEAKSRRLEEVEAALAEIPLREQMSHTLAAVQETAAVQVASAVNELQTTFAQEMDTAWGTMRNDLAHLRSELNESALVSEMKEAETLDRLVEESAAAREASRNLLASATKTMEQSINSKISGFIGELEAAETAKLEEEAAAARRARLESLLSERDGAVASAAEYKSQVEELTATLEAVVGKLQDKVEFHGVERKVWGEERNELVCAREEMEGMWRTDVARLEGRLVEAEGALAAVTQAHAEARMRGETAERALEAARGAADAAVSAAVRAEQAAFEVIRGELEGEVGRLREENAFLKSQVSGLEGALSEVRSSAERERVQLNESVEVARGLENALRIEQGVCAERARIEVEDQRLRGEIKELQSALSESESKVAVLTESGAGSALRVSELEGQNAELRSRMERTMGEMRRAREEVAQARAYASSCQDDNERLLGQLESVMTQLQQQQSSSSMLSRSASMVGSDRSVVAGYQAQIDELHRLIKTLEQEVTRAEEEAGRARIDLQAAQAESEQQRKRAERLSESNMGLEQELAKTAALQRKLDVLMGERGREDGVIAELRGKLVEQERIICQLGARVGGSGSVRGSGASVSGASVSGASSSGAGRVKVGGGMGGMRGMGGKKEFSYAVREPVLRDHTNNSSF